MLSQLIYTSQRKPECNAGEIDKILDSCKRNNSGIDITGVLLYSESMFVQYLEGDSKQILSLYDKIKTDDRHKNVMMMSYAPIKERTFPNWHMGAKEFDSNIDFRTDINQEEKAVFKSLLSGDSNAGNSTLNILKKIFK